MFTSNPMIPHGVLGGHPRHGRRGRRKRRDQEGTGEQYRGKPDWQEGERMKSYSAAVIDGIKRKSRIFVGDSIVRNTDTRLSVVVCLPGAIL